MENTLNLPSPCIMGIVNVTPDSFSDGGEHFHTGQAINQGLQLQQEGADILDIGGESTRPGSNPVSLKDELSRVIPVIEGLRAKTSIPISIDTRKADVMKAAIQAGTNLINDVSALTYDPQSLNIAAKLQVPVILMHAQGDPKTMQDNPTYKNVIAEVYSFLKDRIKACTNAGIAKEKLIIDLGIGFGKSLEHNLALLKNLNHFQTLDVPILVGVSRKRFIQDLTGETDPKKRLPGSLAANLASIQQGAQILRVHDVAEMRQALTIWQAL
ncbi:MAG: dihydropteroate synthase [Pseudomonadota bacterium]